MKRHNLRKPMYWSLLLCAIVCSVGCTSDPLERDQEAIKALMYAHYDTSAVGKKWMSVPDISKYSGIGDIERTDDICDSLGDTFLNVLSVHEDRAEDRAYYMTRESIARYQDERQAKRDWWIIFFGGFATGGGVFKLFPWIISKYKSRRRPRISRRPLFR